MVEMPTEDELRTRIEQHLQHRAGDPAVAHTWGGYLAGLHEWGLLETPSYTRLIKLLPQRDRRAVVEIALGEYAAEHPDLIAAARQVEQAA